MSTPFIKDLDQLSWSSTCTKWMQREPEGSLRCMGVGAFGDTCVKGLDHRLVRALDHMMVNIPYELGVPPVARKSLTSGVKWPQAKR